MLIHILNNPIKVAKVERQFRLEIGKLNEVLPQTDTAQMRSVVTAMEELESSRTKLADNLERNVRHEVVALYNGTDNQR